jgi:4-amino-4-deoxy-L-arabinose transferase-like glycosyltransferase
MVWTEPLFMLLVLASALLLAEHLQRPRWWALIAAGLAVSLAVLTRWAGFAFVAAGALVIVVRLRKSWLERCEHALAFGLVSIIPAVGWMLRNKLVGGTATNRALGIHPPTLIELRNLLLTLYSWAVPEMFWEAVPKWPVGLLLLVLLGCLALLIWRRERQRDDSALQDPRWLMAILSCVMAGGYFAFVLASKTFVDAYISLNDRILIPVYLFAVVGGLCLIHLGLEGLKGEAVRRKMPRVLTAIGCLYFVPIAVVAVVQRRDEDIGHLRSRWRNSPVIAMVDRVPESVPVYSTGPDILYVHTGRIAYRLPPTYDPTTLETNPEYDEAMQRLRRELHSQSGVVVYLEVPWREYLPEQEKLQETLGLKAVAQDGQDALLVPDPENTARAEPRQPDEPQEPSGEAASGLPSAD